LRSPLSKTAKRSTACFKVVLFLVDIKVVKIVPLIGTIDVVIPRVLSTAIRSHNIRPED
jgi:hypothetical protein